MRYPLNNWGLTFKWARLCLAIDTLQPVENIIPSDKMKYGKLKNIKTNGHCTQINLKTPT